MLQEGVIKWGYDTGFNSFSYCCYPGAAFFRDDYNIEALRSYGIYVDIRGDTHMYKDNKRVRDDWIGKNMQYLIGRVGLFKHFQGENFRPWSGENYLMPDRYTNLQVDSQTGRPCPHLSNDGKCNQPVDIDQCDWIDALEDNLSADMTTRNSLSNRDFVNDPVFEKVLNLLEASYFLMNYNETRHLHSFEYIERIEMRNLGPHRVRRGGRTDEEKEDDKLSVVGPYPDHSGGNFKKIEPEFTLEFFDDFIHRKEDKKAERRNAVADFIDTIASSMLERIPVIRDTELFCTDRRRRGASRNRAPKVKETSTNMNPMIAMKLVMRGSIKGFDNNLIKPHMNDSEATFLRENYEFSSNMYKFVYSDNEDDIIEAPFGAEDRPRHFHSKEEAKSFVDEVAQAFLEYQGIPPEGPRDQNTGKRLYTDDQKSRFKLWEFAHSKNDDGSYSLGVFIDFFIFIFDQFYLQQSFKR